MTATAPRSPAPSRRPGWHALVAMALLFGLFLMHGMSASADSACDGRYAQAAAATQGHGAAASATQSGAGTTHRTPGSGSTEFCNCEHSMGASCVPLAQPGTGALLAALLLALAWVPVPRFGLLGGCVSAVRRALRNQRRKTFLALMCVCRT